MTTNNATATGSKVGVAGIEVDILKGGTGPAMLVLHRDTGRAGWTEFHSQLAGRFTVYAPALPGFDESSRPEWMRSVAELATVVGFAIDQVGCAPCPVVGLGFGGWVAAESAVQNPQRFTAMVLHSAVGLQPTSGEIVDQFLYSARDYVKMGFSDSAAFDRLYGAADDEALLRRLDQDREMTTRIAWKPYMFSRALPALLPALKMPALVLHSADDRIVPRSVSERYAELIPGARLAELERAGHQADLESPDELAKQVMDFVR
jgi:pimeloyl-ACP methyl ester carboxylesterase